ncbi:hypothetical protein DPMN_035517 [Dreissena polymorpha]|uniref:Uncharacterized protein n=1 Tax=Dreissena polymorpha TaxID=45954 RepID=A0A9D4M7F9_DREPO|nr:hypothetical protein DPMN_035517 [Dreissena polymorpha]
MDMCLVCVADRRYDPQPSITVVSCHSIIGWRCGIRGSIKGGAVVSGDQSRLPSPSCSSAFS